MKAASIQPESLLASTEHRLVIRATLKPVAGLNRFQPAGFPEIGHVLYDAPVEGGRTTKVCIVDSSPSMANHLETVCLQGAHDPSPVPELAGLPYVRCVTGEPGNPEVVVTTFTEGHRLASTYFLRGKRMVGGKPVAKTFEEELPGEFGLRDLGKKSHPMPKDWWNVFRTIFQYDPGSLVHGILFPQWQIKIPRALTAVHEATGAKSVRSSGVKFDKIGLTNSGQPIFAKDEETAEEIVATFVLDLSLIRSFGRDKLGLDAKQKALLVALSLWKVGALLKSPFRYRSGCDLECEKIEAKLGSQSLGVSKASDLTVDIASYIQAAGFKAGVTDVFWEQKELFKDANKEPAKSKGPEGDDSDAAAEGED